MRSADTVCCTASLLKPLPSTSGGKLSAGEVVSPNNTATVLLNSLRVRRRIGALLGCWVSLVHADCWAEPPPVAVAPPPGLTAAPPAEAPPLPGTLGPVPAALPALVPALGVTPASP